MGFIGLVLIIIILLGISSMFQAEKLSKEIKCDLHTWNWEERVDKPGSFIVICKVCRLRPSLEIRDEF